MKTLTYTYIIAATCIRIRCIPLRIGTPRCEALPLPQNMGWGAHVKPVLIVHRDQPYTDNLKQLLQTFGIDVETFDHPRGYLACEQFEQAHVALIGQQFDDVDGLDVRSCGLRKITRICRFRNRR